jgi:hypothetical protein
MCVQEVELDHLLDVKFASLTIDFPGGGFITFIKWQRSRFKKNHYMYPRLDIISSLNFVIVFGKTFVKQNITLLSITYIHCINFYNI